MLHRFTLLVSLLFVLQTTVFASKQYPQKITFNSQPVIVYNDYVNTFFVFADSSFFFEYSFSTNKWKKRSLHAQLDIPFKQLLAEFAPIAVNKHELLFVHKSCGSVYSFQKGKLKRIDNSFIHKNQYGGAVYGAKGTVYFFGGYGFFEVKNTHDFYLRSANEWFAVAESATNKPSPRANALYVQKNEQLYFIGGEVNKTEGTYYLSDCWNYNIALNSWKMLGYLNPMLEKRLKRATISNFCSSKLVVANDLLIELSPKTNKFWVYRNSFFSSIQQVILDKSEQTALILQKSTNGNQYNVRLYSRHQLCQQPQMSGYLYQKPSIFAHVNFKYLFYILLLTTIFLILLLLFKPTFISNKLNKQTTIHAHQLYPIEWKVLMFIDQHPQVELATLNQFFEEESLNYETLKKRRESLLKGLRKKIAYLTQLKYNDIFIETKHPSDKRIKCIALNSKIKLTDNQ